MADLMLTGTARDFSYLTPPAGQKPFKHPDFETYVSGIVTGIVSDAIGTDGKPVFADTKNAVTSQSSFSSWFNDNPDYNSSAPYTVDFHSTTNPSVLEHDELSGYSPINTYGDQGYGANYSFTEELHTKFTFHGTEDLQFSSDDDLFVFINGKLAVDLGGTHTAALQNLNLTTGGTAAANFGLVLGGTYSIDIFHAERHGATSGVNLQIPTQSTLSVNVTADGTISQQEARSVAFFVDNFDGLTGNAIFTDGKRTVKIPVDHNGNFSADLSDLRGTITSRLTVGNQVSAVGNNVTVAAAALPPTIAGTHATSDAAEAPVTPFGASGNNSAVTVTDSNANSTDTLTIALSGGGGTLTEGPNYAGPKTLTQTVPGTTGTYTLTGTAAAITGELDALIYTPSNPTPGTTASTTFALTDVSKAGASSATDTGTIVTDASTPSTPPAPTLAASSDLGVSNSDDVTNVQKPTFTGAAGAVMAGATVSLYDGQTQIGITTAGADGSYSVTATTALMQGANSVTVTQTANNLQSAMSPATTVTLDTMAPAITAVADSGPGIDANGNGDLGAGKTVTLTVTTSEPIYVQGGAPTLTLNDGATATYTGGSGSNQLTFTSVVAAGQNASTLQATGVVLSNGATVQDGAGNAADLSGAAKTFAGLQVDTTAPAASSPTATVAQNSGPASIGIAAPSDNLTPAGSLVLTAGTLPTDGTVTLADGTPVASGQVLTAAQLTGLQFTPTPGVSGQGSTFTYTVTDGAGNATQGTAALNVGAAGGPTITGTHATTDQAEAPVAPFTGVTVSDPSSAAGATETLTIALTGGGGTLTGAGLTTVNGGYQLTGTAAQVTQQLNALSFTPAAGLPGTTTSTTFVLTDWSSTGGSVVDSRTSVADTATAVPPPPPPPPPSPTPGTVSLSPVVTYDHGVFTLSGTAASPAGVGSVEISAVVNGVRQDLGAATVAADGTFTFQNAIGPAAQSSITATETDRAGRTASAQADYALTGGLGPRGGVGRQDSFNGGEQVSSTLFRPNGTRQVSVEAPGQTVELDPYDIAFGHGQGGTTFVYKPGEEKGVIDVIHGFKFGGADHDTLSLNGADFGNSIANVLRNTGDVNGSAFITDPVTGDAIRLAGVSTAELKHKDFSFHA